jgi:histidinol-phosphate aminotransferase
MTNKITQSGQPAASPAPASQVYTWEASNAAIAARYGLDPADVLRFDTNTSPAPPGRLPEWLAQLFDPSLNEYPDSSYAELTDAAAAYIGVRPEQVVVGAGADEVLDMVAKAFLPAGSAALVPIPTYPMYGVLTSQRDARIVSVPRLARDAGFSLDLEAVVARLEDVRVVWLCSPNNPTGQQEPPDQLRAVLSAAETVADPPLVVVDEAYFEFIDSSLVASIEAHRRLLVVRTMSKAFALAGARVGFGIGAREVIERLERVRPPGSISTISAHVASRALAEPCYARDNVTRIVAEREWLSERLTQLGLAPSPSVTNFLLVRFGQHDAAEAAADMLLRHGIVPRTFGPANPLRGHLRLTVRSRPENQRLVQVLGRL